jgi:cytochrome b subunit of formate dehydrogenase
VTENVREQGQEVIGGTSSRAAPWLAWPLVTLSVVLLVGGIVLAQMTRSTAPGRQYYGSFETVFVLATVLTFSVVGAIIASRQPRNAIGWIFCGIGLVVSLNSLTGSYAEYQFAGGSAPGSLAETAAWFSSWSWTLWIYVPTTFLLLLFPDGQLPSPRWRPVAWCAALGIIGFDAGYALAPGPLEEFPQITNPYGVDSPILDAVALAGVTLAGASMVASAVSLIVRMRRAGRVERQQIKWLAYGGAVVVGTVFVGGVISVWIGEVGISLIIIGLLGVPIFTGVAIARYRLYDIDLLINRTLVYGSLTTLLVMAYFGGVVGSQRLLSPLIGDSYQLATVASTLVIAALFNPLRRRVQAFVDRRFYRRKYDAAKILEAFGSRLREGTDLDALSNDVVRVARRTVQPEYVSLWLRPDAKPQDRSAALIQVWHDE